MSDVLVAPSRRLNCGSGKNPLPYWTNCDLDKGAPAEIHAEVPPIPFEDASLDEIFAGHFLECLTREEAKEFLKECYRVLVPGGKLGIVVPDMYAIMERYVNGDAVPMDMEDIALSTNDLDDLCKAIIFGSAGTGRFCWAYDLKTLRRAMEDAQFHVIREINRVSDPRIVGPAWFQCGLDAVKPKVLKPVVMTVRTWDIRE